MSSRKLPLVRSPAREAAKRDLQLQADNDRGFEEYRKEAERRQVSSMEAFGKSLLTYSGSGLVLSIAFLKDFIPLQFARAHWLLAWSWVLFSCVIILTTVAFLVSYHAQAHGIEVTRRRVYGPPESGEEVEGQSKTKTSHIKGHWCNGAVARLNVINVLLFIISVGFTTAFVSMNVSGASSMATKKISSDKEIPIPPEPLRNEELLAKTMGQPAFPHIRQTTLNTPKVTIPSKPPRPPTEKAKT